MAKDNLSLPFKSHPGFLLRMSAHSSMSRLATLLSNYDLRIAEATVISVVEANPGCRQRDIGQALNIASANLTPLASRLEERDIIRREPVDGRSNALFLTPTGKKLAREAMSAMRDFESDLLNRVPKALQAPLVEALKYLAEPAP